MTKKKLQEGDIFYVPYKNEYFFGKILLDVSERILNKENVDVFSSFTGCYLVAIYKGIYDKPILGSKEYIIPSAYTYKKEFYSRKDKVDWFFYKNEPIDYKILNFPESLIDVHRKGICFTTGELEIPTSLTSQDYDNQFRIRKSINLSFYTLLEYACFYQDKKDLMNFIPKILLDSSDFRFNSQKRELIYKNIIESPNQNYYELALKHGFDLGRFYK